MIPLFASSISVFPISVHELVESLCKPQHSFKDSFGVIEITFAGCSYFSSSFLDFFVMFGKIFPRTFSVLSPPPTSSSVEILTRLSRFSTEMAAFIQRDLQKGKDWEGRAGL